MQLTPIRDSNKGVLHFKKKNSKQSVDYSDELFRKISEPKKQEILSELATNTRHISKLIFSRSENQEEWLGLAGNS